ncbi:poly-gamma-glutamate hydrolase family protein [Bacillus licheniformis]
MKGTAKLNNLFSRIKFLPKTGNRLKQTFIEGGRVLQPTKATTLYHPALPKSEKHTNYIMFSLFFAIQLLLSPVVQAADKYQNFTELQANEDPANYNIESVSHDPSVLIFAPHGGGIEGGTSEIARHLSSDYSMYLFEGLKSSGNFNLHITSTNFDEPTALKMISKHQYVISLHGYRDNNEHVIVGGSDTLNAARLTEVLNNAGISAEHRTSGSLAGVDPGNIANKCITGKSIQIEMSAPLRKSMFETFTLSGRSGSQNERFYLFTNLLTIFIKNTYESGVNE